MQFSSPCQHEETAEPTGAAGDCSGVAGSHLGQGTAQTGVRPALPRALLLGQLSTPGRPLPAPHVTPQGQWQEGTPRDGSRAQHSFGEPF